MEIFDSKEAKPVPNPESRWKTLEKAPALLAAVSTSLYVVGFLVVTGFLGSKGIHDHPFISARYIVAGGLSAVCALMYYFFVWRKMARRARDGLKFRPGLSAAFRGYVTHYFVLEDLFGCAFFSVWLVAIFGTTANAQLYGIGAAAIYFFDQRIFAFCGPRHPTASFALSGLLLGTSTAAFAVASAFSAPLFAVFAIASGFTLISTVVLTSEDWTQDRDRFYGTSYLIFMAVVAAIGFGTTVYGQLSPRFGGGQPPRVTVIFSKGADANLRAPIEAASTQVFLLSDDKETLTLELGEPAKEQKVLRLDRSLVQAIQFERIVQKDAVAEWVSARLVAAAASAGSASKQASPASAANNPSSASSSPP